MTDHRAFAGHTPEVDDDEREHDLRWYTLAEVAKMCRRHESTIRNIVSMYRLPVRRGWTTAHRKRYRRVMFSHAIAKMLQTATLFRDPSVLPPPRPRR